MKIIKILGISISSLLLLFIVAALGYRLVKSQGVISSFTINEDSYKTRILIASQEREFKTEILRQVSNHFKGIPLFIQVIDVTDLGAVDPEDWDGFVILTTVQSSDIQKDARSFLEKIDGFDNVLLLLTADSKRWPQNDLGIDDITSASLENNIDIYAQYMINFIENRMAEFK